MPCGVRRVAHSGGSHCGGFCIPHPYHLLETRLIVVTGKVGEGTSLAFTG